MFEKLWFSRVVLNHGCELELSEGTFNMPWPYIRLIESEQILWGRGLGIRENSPEDSNVQLMVKTIGPGQNFLNLSVH